MRKVITQFVVVAMGVLFAVPAFAADGADSSQGTIAMAAAICMGLGTFGGAMSQSRAAAAALEGIARNPQAAPKVHGNVISAAEALPSRIIRL